MAIWHKVSRRKATGGLIHRSRKSKFFESGNEPIKTVIGPRKVKQVIVHGGNFKLKLRSNEEANVFDQQTKTMKKVKVTDVVENKANPHFVRQKVITKGALVKTSLGISRVTSRPGQSGTIDAVLVDKKDNAPAVKVSDKTEKKHKTAKKSKK